MLGNTNVMKYNPVNSIFKPGTGMSYLTDPLQIGVPPSALAAPATPPPAPTLGNSADSLDVAAQQQQMMLQRGRSATLLTGGGGLNGTQSASHTLLGQ